MKVTKEFVVAYHAFMCAKFWAITVPHNEILDLIPGKEELNLVLMTLKVIGIPSPLEWLEKNSFCLGPYISIHYTPGVGAARHLVGQCGTLAHEIGHRIQYDEEDDLLFDYAMSRARRADLETWAELGKHEAQFEIAGTIPSTQAFERSLIENYLCSPTGARIAKRKLDKHAINVRAGAVMTPVGKATRQFVKGWKRSTDN
jgi:hypothetical protein